MRLLIVALLLVGCGVEGVPGNGKPKTDARFELRAFNKVKLSGALRAEINVGISQLVEISGDENLVPLIETIVTEDELRIRPTKRIAPKLPLVAKMTTATLTAVDASGSTDIDISDVGGDAFAITGSGSMKLRADGRVHKLSINISGSATVDTKALVAEDVSLHVSGSGDVVVFASGTLDVHISGSGRVRYAGSPRNVQKAISGSGSVESVQ
jgi:hypothetical protein